MRLDRRLPPKYQLRIRPHRAPDSRIELRVSPNRDARATRFTTRRRRGTSAVLPIPGVRRGSGRRWTSIVPSRGPPRSSRCASYRAEPSSVRTRVNGARTRRGQGRFRSGRVRPIPSFTRSLEALRSRDERGISLWTNERGSDLYNLVAHGQWACRAGTLLRWRFRHAPEPRAAASSGDRPREWAVGEAGALLTESRTGPRIVETKDRPGSLGISVRCPSSCGARAPRRRRDLARGVENLPDRCRAGQDPVSRRSREGDRRPPCPRCHESISYFRFGVTPRSAFPRKALPPLNRRPS